MQLLPRAQRSATKAQFQVGGQKTQVFCPPEDGKISLVPPVSGAQPKRNPFSGRSAIYFQDVFRWEQGNKTSAIHNRINVIRPRHLYFPCFSQMHPPCREGKMDALPSFSTRARISLPDGGTESAARVPIRMSYPSRCPVILQPVLYLPERRRGFERKGPDLSIPGGRVPLVTLPTHSRGLWWRSEG